MQLSAVCAAHTVLAQPGRQTEKCCSHRLTFLTVGQHNRTHKTEANKQHTMLFYHGAMLTEVQKLPKISTCTVFLFQNSIFILPLIYKLRKFMTDFFRMFIAK